MGRTYPAQCCIVAGIDGTKPQARIAEGKKHLLFILGEEMPVTLLTRIDLDPFSDTDQERFDAADHAQKVVHAFSRFGGLLQVGHDIALEQWILDAWKEAVRQGSKGEIADGLPDVHALLKRRSNRGMHGIFHDMEKVKNGDNSSLYVGLQGLVLCVRENVRQNLERFKGLPCFQRKPRKKTEAKQ